MENESGFVKQVKLCGAEIPEVREKISDLLTAQDAAKIDLEGAFGEVMIKISSDGENARETVKAAVRELKVRFGSSIYTTKKSVSLEQTIVDLLKEQQMTVSTVESCTGGMISARLTDVPGCSEVFRQGFVTYSDRAKRKMVGVKKSTLKKYTAVSEQTAKEMAKGGAFMAPIKPFPRVTGVRYVCWTDWGAGIRKQRVCWTIWCFCSFWKSCRRQIGSLSRCVICRIRHRRRWQEIWVSPRCR